MADNEELDPRIIGMCTECKSAQTMNYMKNNSFAKQGDPPPCQYCGGVVAVVHRDNEEQAKKQMDRERGIDSGRASE